MREFGERVPGTYVERRGAYGMAFDAMGRCAVVESPIGVFLPGGGIEPGERPEETLAREVLEETGRTVTILAPLGEAVQYRPGHNGGCFAVHAIYFHVTLGNQVASIKEADHTLLWLPLAEALQRLTRDSDKWKVATTHAENRFVGISTL